MIPRPVAIPCQLVTDRLSIELLELVDLDAFVAYRQDPDVARWQSWSPDYSTDEARRLIETQPTTTFPTAGDWVQLAIHDRVDGSLRGDVAVHLLPEQPDTFEIGATLAPASQRQGFAEESARAIIGYLFSEAGAHRVVAFCDSRNDAVARLFQRIGMRHESRQVDADHFKGEWSTLDGYAILASEWTADTSSEGRKSALTQASRGQNSASQLLS